MRRVLVIGGTGFLGRAIAEAFARRGEHVSVLTRGQHSVDGLGEVELLQADRSDPVALRAAIGERSFEVAVDNIAYDGADARNVLEALEGRVGHYVQTSSAAVYANRYVRRPLREGQADLSLRVAVDAPNPFHSRLGHGYANGKRSAEQVATESGVPWTVLRPPVILAADDRTRRVWWFVQRLLDGGPLLIPDWGAGRVFQLAWTHDIARAFCAAAGKLAAHRQAYNVAQAEVYTAESWIEAAASVLGVQARYAHVAEDDLADLGLGGYTLPVAGRPFGHVLLDTHALECDLGFEVSPEEVWLKDTIEGCAAHPPPADSPGYDRRDREIEVARRIL